MTRGRRIVVAAAALLARMEEESLDEGLPTETVAALRLSQRMLHEVAGRIERGESVEAAIRIAVEPSEFPGAAAVDDWLRSVSSGAPSGAVKANPTPTAKEWRQLATLLAPVLKRDGINADAFVDWLRPRLERYWRINAPLPVGADGSIRSPRESKKAALKFRADVAAVRTLRTALMPTTLPPEHWWFLAHQGVTSWAELRRRLGSDLLKLEALAVAAVEAAENPPTLAVGAHGKHVRDDLFLAIHERILEISTRANKEGAYTTVRDVASVLGLDPPRWVKRPVLDARARRDGAKTVDPE